MPAARVMEQDKAVRSAAGCAGRKKEGRGVIKKSRNIPRARAAEAAADGVLCEALRKRRAGGFLQGYPRRM